MKEYIIVGDAGQSKGCLIYTCGADLNYANDVLQRILERPNKNDLYSIEGHTNLRVEEVESDDCWWNDPFLAN